METVIKVVFEEINDRAYAFRFTRGGFDSVVVTRCAIYRANAYSNFIGPGEDDFETLFNLVNNENEIVEDFKDAAIIATIEWNSGIINMEPYQGNYRQLHSLIISVLGKAGEYLALFNDGKELPNEAEFHES